MSLGSKVRELRRDMSWSQQQLADRSGVGHAYISRLERDGFKNPSADILLRLARALKVDIEQLYEAAGYIGERSKGEKAKQQGYLKVLPLLSPGHQRVVEIVVRELAKVEGIKAASGPQGRKKATD